MAEAERAVVEEEGPHHRPDWNQEDGHCETLPGLEAEAEWTRHKNLQNTLNAQFLSSIY